VPPHPLATGRGVSDAPFVWSTPLPSASAAAKTTARTPSLMRLNTAGLLSTGCAISDTPYAPCAMVAHGATSCTTNEEPVRRGRLPGDGCSTPLAVVPRQRPPSADIAPKNAAQKPVRGVHSLAVSQRLEPAMWAWQRPTTPVMVSRAGSRSCPSRCRCRARPARCHGLRFSRLPELHLSSAGLTASGSTHPFRRS
jgi:hypothetical protein